MLGVVKCIAVVLLGMSLSYPAEALSATADTQKKPPAAETKKETPRSDRVDLNSASLNELKAVPGMTEANAKKIIDGRPYARRRDLLAKKVLDQESYDKVKERVYTKRTK